MTFEEIINSEKLTLVVFFATWCGPCKMYAEILELVKDRIQDNATIIKIDIDKNPAVAEKYNIQSVPSSIIFKNGEIKWREAGVRSIHELETLINHQYV